MTRPSRPELTRYGRPKRVDGGIRAQSTRGDIGESWWSKRFISVLESFSGLGGRLARGRNYARAGQVLSLTIEPGTVHARVQGSVDPPYRVQIGLSTYDDPTWTRIEQAMAAQALFAARLLAGEMPPPIEEAFSAAGAPLFPTSAADLRMSCSCPDATVPCKHIAATFYLLAEAFDADPFQILHWRGRDRATLLANLRVLRTTAAPARTARRRAGTAAKRAGDRPHGVGAAAALVEAASADRAASADLTASVTRFWVAPVPLPTRPPTLTTDVDLVLRQLPTPDPWLGGRALVDALRPLYAAFRP
ncbi:MAG: SWIM zinc finger family protein [Micromonosporaceae bacterium]|nr:SWIM zinc finger family protein [Micromonosporaceae bacterium]